MAVGLTALAPGKKTTLEFPYLMHVGMEGPHLFEVVIKSNDTVEPEKKLTVKAVTGR